MLDDYRLFTTQLVVLWAMLNPIGLLPLFLGATTTLSASQRRRAACFSIVIAFGILTIFALAGPMLLHAMGISRRSFQIAGGMIVFVFALNMVLGDAPASPFKTEKGDSAMSVAVHPLATPIIAGPGAMLTIVLLMDNNRDTVLQQALTIVALAAVLAVMLGVFLLSETLRRLIGANGANLIRRIMGLLLAALAVNMVLSAVALWLRLPEI
ncbi:MarC family protein [Bosea caraganae]|uniref:UPF0056 membrane protein n=1 Tax=Bosea caraganae TaxID=2763117 RepID=A0A370LAP0_9HYPH|nr:MarC family protein [Bosea caraganae]RDJ27017.1 MarC family protein [Bosea caraganae]RDJ29034.1 MarC family protein [Bosea caraganae]